jgi:DNA replicative helicase MCM subunit Mcm2 (Cdc46/Mcm family)
MARIRFSEEVEQSDIDEALRLMDVSQASVAESLDEEIQCKQK